MNHRAAELSVEILYQDNHLLVVNKPPGLATMGAQDGRPTLHQWACRDIARRFNKPGKVFIGVVHRLDQPTSGVVVLARTSKAASRLSAQFAAKSSTGSRERNTGVQKQYLAILRGCVDVQTRWSDHLYKDDHAKRMRVANHDSRRPADGNAETPKLAVTDVSPLSVTADFSLVEIELATGRKHQIRVQSAHHGSPVVGDFKYDGQPPGTRLMLHAMRLTIEHPTKKHAMTFLAPPPDDFVDQAKSLGLEIGSLRSKLANGAEKNAFDANLSPK